MAQPSLASHFLANPQAILRACFRPRLEGATHLSFQSLEDYFFSLGYTRKDIDDAINEIAGFTLDFTLEPKVAAADAEKKEPIPAPGAQDQSSSQKPARQLRLPAKAFPGKYIFTKYGDLTETEIQKLGPLSIGPDLSSWNHRSCTYAGETSRAELKFDDYDCLYHLHWTNRAGDRGDLAFWLELDDQSRTVSKFSGEIFSGNTTTAVAGTIEGNSVSKGFGLGGWRNLVNNATNSTNSGNNTTTGHPSTGEPTSNIVIGVIIVVGMIAFFGYIFYLYRNQRAQSTRRAVQVHPSASGNTADITVVELLGDDSRTGIDPHRNILAQQRTEQTQEFRRMPEEERIARVLRNGLRAMEERMKKVAELLELKRTTTCKVNDLPVDQQDDDDNDSYRGPDDSRNLSLNTPAPTSQQSVDFASGFTAGTFSALQDVESTFVDALTARAIEKLSNAFTHLDEIGEFVSPPTLPLVDWATITQLAMDKTTKEGLGEDKLVSIDDLQTLFLDNLQPYVFSALLPHLSLLYSEISKTAQGKLALDILGTPDFSATVMNVSIRQAMCSDSVGESLVSEIRRTLATKAETGLPVSDPALSSFAAFQAQQKIEEAAQKKQESLYSTISQFEKLIDSGEKDLVTASDKLAAALQMKRAAGSTDFASLYQFQNYPSSDWVLLVGRFGQGNIGKEKATGVLPPVASGNHGISNKSGLQPVANATGVYMQVPQRSIAGGGRR